MPSATRYQLNAILGPEAGQIYYLEPSVTLLGRAPEAQIVLTGSMVSRIHARITFSSGRFLIEDRGSANGTFVNGVKIGSPYPLSSGDKITLGENVAFEFQEVPAGEVSKDTIILTNGLDVLTESVEDSSIPLSENKADSATQPYQKNDPMVIGKKSASPKMIVMVAGEDSQTYPLIDSRITIGRDEDNYIVIRSPIISRHHALLESIPDGYLLTIQPDNTNETYLDGMLVQGAQKLIDNAVIRVGSAEAGQLVTMYFQLPEGNEPGFARIIQVGGQGKLLIGRDLENDIVLDAPSISRFQAEIESVGQRFRVRDLRSLNGTFLNNQRIHDETWAKPQDHLRIGPYLFILGENALERIDQTHGVRIDAFRLNKQVRKDLNLLQDISLVLKPREFVVVVGQSGGGKTTLVDAMAGYRPATNGQVFLNDTDLYRHFDALRSGIGYVPQRDIIHLELTVFESLDYAAKLRMPPDVSAAERRTRILQVLDDLDLAHMKDEQISKLSGGQQKRVSIGVELLTQPGLFFLDEPTSGLDPGTETSLMQLMRRLADQGRTIVLITHATKNVMLADKVVFLARGGYLAWFGPPDEALTYFSQFQSDREQRHRGMDFDQIYSILDDPTKGVPQDWQLRYQKHLAFQKYIREPLLTKGHDLDAADPRNHKDRNQSDGITKFQKSKTSAGRFNPFLSIRQFAILSARNLKILSRDRISLLLMLVAAPLVGMLDFVLASGMDANPFDYKNGDFSPAVISLFLFSIYGVLVGGISQMREIVKEKAVYRRERLVNLEILPYVLSKMWVAGLLALYHAVAYTVLHYLAFDMPGGALEFFLVYITVVLATFSGMMMGLFASALAPNSNTVPLIVILLMIPQIVLGGALIPLPEPVTAITSTRWAFQSFLGISGIGSDLAADPCWELSAADRETLTLEQSEQLGCLCLGIDTLRQDSCEFPGLGMFYNPAIDEPEPEKPTEIGQPPEKPQLPDAPQQPGNPNDLAAMNVYLSELRAYQELTASVQANYETEVQAYQQNADQYQQALITYQNELAAWQISRNEAIGQAEGMLSRFENLFGWAIANKDSDNEYAAMLAKTWSAQGLIISVYFLLIVGLMKLKDKT